MRQGGVPARRWYRTTISAVGVGVRGGGAREACATVPASQSGVEPPHSKFPPPGAAGWAGRKRGMARREGPRPVRRGAATPLKSRPTPVKEAEIWSAAARRRFGLPEGELPPGGSCKATVFAVGVALAEGPRARRARPPPPAKAVSSHRTPSFRGRVWRGGRVEKGGMARGEGPRPLCRGAATPLKSRPTPVKGAEIWSAAARRRFGLPARRGGTTKHAKGAKMATGRIASGNESFRPAGELRARPGDRARTVRESTLFACFVVSTFRRPES